ncbi:MAG: hypothetical protein OEU32_19355, partial [Acidimicrobiia bacterium]|nr:hypothetical protein [Acidimicrobiia bacterium]
MNVSEYFDELVGRACADLAPDESLTANINGEQSDFVRFNDAAIRQAGSVRQLELDIDLGVGDRHCGGTITLAGDPEIDDARVAT